MFPDWIANFVRRVIQLLENLPEEGPNGNAGGATEGWYLESSFVFRPVLGLIAILQSVQSRSSTLSQVPAVRSVSIFLSPCMTWFWIWCLSTPVPMSGQMPWELFISSSNVLQMPILSKLWQNSSLCVRWIFAPNLKMGPALFEPHHLQHPCRQTLLYTGVRNFFMLHPDGVDSFNSVYADLAILRGTVYK